MSDNKEKKSSSLSTTVGVGVLCAALGLGIGNYMTKHDGFSAAPAIEQQADSSTFDSAELPILGSPARGGANAEATVVIFTDLQCPASRELHGQFFDHIFKSKGSKVKVVYKAYPLAIHAEASYAAQAAAAAGKQGKFWQMFDAIYNASKSDSTNKDFLSPEKLSQYAQKIGLNMELYKKDVDSNEVKAMVQKDIELGKKLELVSTPSVFINGKRVKFENGVNEKDITQAVDEAIANVDKLLAKPNINYYIATQLSDGQKVNAAPVATSTSQDALKRSSKGNPNALVTIVEFSDYQCPFCSRVEPTIAQILKEYPNEVRVVFNHNPLSFHKDAKPAAQAAYAAGLQNKFWEMHELLFANQKQLSRDNLIMFAKQLGLDEAKFIADMDSPQTVAIIDANLSEASKKGVNGTPGFLINDQFISGAQPYENFKKAIDEELAQARELSSKTGLTGEALYNEIVKNYKPSAKPNRPEQNANEGKIFVDINGAPVMGDPNAPVTIVEFTDFQCPFCAKASKTLNELLAKNAGKIKIVFKHNPLSFHNQAKLAHQAAEAASLQGKFWEMYELLFNNQKALERDNLISYAKQLGLDEAKFVADMDSQAVIDRVEADLKQGESVAVKGTPHFFINGTRMSGARPLDAIQTAVDKEFEKAKAYTEKGLVGEELYKKIIEDGKVMRRLPDRRPRGPRTGLVIDTNGNYAKGPDNAPVTIVQFSDFQCPFCSKVEPTITQLMTDYAGKIRVVFKNKPLSFHADAPLAAEAVLAAGEQGKFWEMHEILFANQKALKRENLDSYAQQLGLDMTKFAAALDTHKFKEAVDKDIEASDAVQITGTPAFVINGTLVSGAQPIERFKEVIDKALDPAAAAAPAPTLRPAPGLE